jgi:hypothetical protein
VRDGHLRLRSCARKQDLVLRTEHPKPQGNKLPTTAQKPDAERLQSTTSTVGFAWLVKDDPDAEGEAESSEEEPRGRQECARNSVKFDV